MLLLDRMAADVSFFTSAAHNSSILNMRTWAISCILRCYVCIKVLNHIVRNKVGLKSVHNRNCAGSLTRCANQVLFGGELNRLLYRSQQFPPLFLYQFFCCQSKKKSNIHHSCIYHRAELL